MKTYTSITEYVHEAPADKQQLLENMRKEIRAAAPNATESIKYGMPTFELKGNLVHFAAMKGHLGFYPTPSAIQKFKKELSEYETSKGCIRFPYDQEVPYALVQKIVKFRVKENLAK